MDQYRISSVSYALAFGLLLTLGGCGGSDGETANEAVVVEGDFPIVFAKRQVGAVGNPTDGVIFRPGGDLLMRDLSSPSAQEMNITGDYTQGQGDVSDPEVSYDGTRILFSMRGPNDPSWNVWEYEIETAALRRIVSDDGVANAGDDVDPAYLPDGRIVFSSNRQEKSRQVLQQKGVEPYAHLDEYERERAILLHVMNSDGTEIDQISFNQSHDRNPTVLSTGEIMFARWDHVGNRNHFPLFFTNPDGTNIFVQYGAFSPGNSFLHPREMPSGQVMSSLMPLSGTREGGAVMAIDIRECSENSDCDPNAPEGTTGQESVTLFQIDFGMGVSEFGRYTTPFPLWDGTNRALVSWSPFRPEDETNPLTGEVMEVEGDPLYGVYMLDLDTQSLRPIALPEEGFAYVDAIAVAARPTPNTIADKQLDAALAAEGMAILNVKSVYDTDGQNLMGTPMLAPGENIPMTSPPPDDTRSQVADLARMKDPAQTTAEQRPGRFVRVTQAVPTPRGLSREAIGETDLEMQQIVGYVPLEPDGSFRIKVPADTPLGLAVVDADGRAFQTHTNWIQARPGETRTCNGCHSPRRGSAINSAPIAGFHPNTLLTAESGESMAETLTRLDTTALDVMPDMVFTDVWTDPAQAIPAADLVLDYSGLPAGVPAPVDGIVNYPEHIQPLWTADRGADTCTGCHNNNDPDDPVSMGLDLRDTVTGTGRVLSYEEVMIGDPVIDPDTGLPEIRVDDDGEVEVVREDGMVMTGSSRESSRTSFLVEKLYEQELRAGNSLTVPPSVDHSGMLNASEKRLVAEWIDLGGQYYNDAFDDANNDGFRASDEVRGGVRGLSEASFESSVHPFLMDQCAACHQPFGGLGIPGQPVNELFSPNRLVLTGNVEGDFNVSLSMVNDVCDPAASYLLLYPSGDETTTPMHPRIDDTAVADDPQDPTLDDRPVLLPTDPAYLAIFNWIAAGNCST
ncbi:MAG: hypothetical protein WBN65_15905 [Gammaproteobacteria bacterium]